MINTILQLGALQAVVLTIFLFTKKVNRVANRLLSLIVLILGVLCLLQSVKNVDTYLILPHLVRLDWGGGLLIAPLMFLYTVLMTGKKKAFEVKDLWIFFPYIVNLIILMPFFFQDGESKVAVLDHFTAAISAGTDLYASYHKVLTPLTALIGSVFCFRSLKVLNTYQGMVKDEFSAIQKMEMEWLRWLLYAFFLLYLSLGLAFYLFNRDVYASFDYEVYFYLVAFVLIYFITYRTLNQSQVQVPKEGPKTGLGQNHASSVKVNVDPVLSTTLVDLMKSEKPFLEGDLTATQLAKMCSVSRHQLSQVLSKSLNTNFYDYVNYLRIEEFKKRVESGEYKHLTLLAIAFDSGFNSKTSFNTAFKKNVGVTPSQYKKNFDQKVE